MPKEGLPLVADEKAVLLIFEAALKEARKFAEHAEDIAQEVVLAFLEGQAESVPLAVNAAARKLRVANRSKAR